MNGGQITEFEEPLLRSTCKFEHADSCCKKMQICWVCDINMGFRKGILT